MTNPCKNCDIKWLCVRLPKDLTCEEVRQYAEAEKKGEADHA